MQLKRPRDQKPRVAQQTSERAEGADKALIGDVNLKILRRPLLFVLEVDVCKATILLNEHIPLFE